MKKQLLILTLMCLSIIGYSQTFTDNFISYNVTSALTVEVTDYDVTNGGSILIIPASVNYNSTNYSVTSIKFLAFQNSTITSVDIPDSLIDIGVGAFSGSSLDTLTFGNSVATIGGSAFLNCSLSSVTIPDSVTSIGNYAFQNNSLINLSIGNNVSTIGTWAFTGNQLASITIPNSVTTIGDFAFQNNPLTLIISEAIIPPTITTSTTSGMDTFATNRSTIDLTIPTGTTASYVTDSGALWTGFNSVTEAGSAQVGDTFIDNFITYEVTSLTPDTVQTIDYDMAGGNVVDIPDMVSNNGISYTVTQIGINAFSNNQLTSVIIPDSVIYIINNAFAANQLQTVTIPNGVLSIGGSAFVNNQINSLTLPNSVTAIGLAAFATNQLTSVTIPESVNSLAALVFNNNPLTSVTSESITPPIITTGSGDSFASDRSGIDLTIPSGTTNDYLSNGWTGFNSVTEAGSVQVGDTFIDNFITYEVTSLTPDTVETIDYDIAGGTVVDIPAIVTNSTIDFEVTAIGSSAFNNKGLTNVTIPNSVVSTSYQSFANNQLTSIVIPDSVTTTGNSTFLNNQLTSVTLPDNITVLGSFIFGNNQLTTIEIPDGVTLIADMAFFNNALTHITIPSSVTTIAGAAFRNNPLASVTSESTTPPSIFTGGNNDSFSNDRSGIDLIIPIGTTGPYVTDPGALWTGFNTVTESVLSVSDFEFSDDIKVISTPESIKIISNNGARLHNFELYNITGSKITFGSQTEIGTNSISKGIYILKLNFDKGTVVRKVVVN